MMTSSLDLGIHAARDLAQNRPLWRPMSLHRGAIRIHSAVRGLRATTDTWGRCPRAANVPDFASDADTAALVPCRP